MLQNLQDICNQSNLVLIYGNNVSNAVRNMLQLVKGDYTLTQLSTITFQRTEVLPKKTLEMSAVTSEETSVHINLVPLHIYMHMTESINAQTRNRYWVWAESDCVDTDTLEEFNAFVYVKDGRVCETVMAEMNRSFEQLRRDNMGTWYAFCMSLFDDVMYRVSYQSLGLFLSNIYSFIEYSCAKLNDVRNLSTARNLLGTQYSSILGKLFRLKFVFTSEPFSRKEAWDLMRSILEDEEFYGLLKLYFGNSYKELENLRQIKYIVAIEMDKEGL